jgi:hypothetical protein
MNSAAYLVGDLRARNIEVTFDGEDIVVRAERDALQPEDIEALQSAKPLVLARLKAEDEAITQRIVAMRARFGNDWPRIEP